MLLIDVNVLIYAFREDAVGHRDYRRWLDGCIAAERAYGLADLVLSGFLRIVTHPGIFTPPTPLELALRFVATVRDQENCVRVAPGSRHWDIFVNLCRHSQAKGALIPDAYLAALAIENGSEWVTTDRDYRRFPGLRWRHPLHGKVQ